MRQTNDKKSIFIHWLIHKNPPIFHLLCWSPTIVTGNVTRAASCPAVSQSCNFTKRPLTMVTTYRRRRMAKHFWDPKKKRQNEFLLYGLVLCSCSCSCSCSCCCCCCCSCCCWFTCFFSWVLRFYWGNIWSSSCLYWNTKWLDEMI